MDCAIAILVAVGRKLRSLRNDPVDVDARILKEVLVGNGLSLNEMLGRCV